MKGVIITSGFGTRLWPVTTVYPKIFHLIYDKPSVFYNLALLIDMEITDICIVGTPSSNVLLKKLLDDSYLGINITFIDEKEEEVKGTATSLLKAQQFINNDDFTLFLGDSLFIDMSNRVFLELKTKFEKHRTSLTITTPVWDARPFAYFDNGKAVEKGKDKAKREAIPGFYIFSTDVFKYLKRVKVSPRDEYEIVSAVNLMIKDHKFISEGLQDSIVWIDTGSVKTLQLATNLVGNLQQITGVLVGSPHLEALKKQLINRKQLHAYLTNKKGLYASRLQELITSGSK
ncbi:MAG: sugar phosphate nucleotidyltransferase [Lactobacillus iners]|jgi:glucose-1-phosphate thymidylyltransferase|nr:sugar phosphate nucleotidyltransferase [Lactobacillus iners]MCT7813866.1 sugar phosphate nucleotidyltransferase [Lactobacillus iners]MCT7830092.1 sugar phosphate nucleotidyltransferase [Lactobacillus iners]MCT7844167.1 sugar phosphate nucleotidyltransferase [Lactobacillus iners]